MVIWQRVMRTPAVLCTTLFVVGCSDELNQPLTPTPPQTVLTSSSIDPVPPRTEDLAGAWEELGDEELWEHIAAQGGEAVYGVKNPGQARGIWRGNTFTLPQTLNGAANALRDIDGVELLRESEHLPYFTVRFGSFAAFTEARGMPFRDYLQPLYMQPIGENTTMDGCGWGNAYTGGAQQTSWGDPISPGIARMAVPDAWHRNAGEAAVIGVTDTGVSADQGELSTSFSTGSSATNRWHSIRTVISGGTDDQCGHGTRVSGLAFAPNNGSSLVGVAWKANGVSVRQGNGVSTSFGINSDDAASALVMAVDEKFNEGFSTRRIVSMAWGAATANSNVEDAVRYNDARGALHLAASGTSSWALSWGGVVFPARMSEVVAVSAVDPAGESMSNIHYGSDVELSSYVDQLGTGEYDGQTRTLGGSSAATTVMAGIAALVWTQFPSETNTQIRQRLWQAGNEYPNRNNTVGYGVVNAMRAVGGLWNVQVSRTLVSGGGFNQPAVYDLTATPRGGEGPYSYHWNTGQTAQTIRVYTAPGDPSYTYSVTVSEPDPYGTSAAQGSIVIDPPPGGCSDPREIIC